VEVRNQKFCLADMGEGEGEGTTLVQETEGTPEVTLKKYRGKGVDYIMAASGRIQYDSNKQKPIYRASD
jgi:hypothetical protein